MTALTVHRSCLLLVCFVAATALLVPAQDAPEAETPAPEAGAAATESVDTNAQAMAALRDPFWPVGYVRIDKEKLEREREEEERRKREAEKNKQMPIAWPKIDVTAVSKTPNGYIAMIRGIGFVEKGQIIKISQQGILYRWEITTINDQGVSYKKLDATRIGQ